MPCSVHTEPCRPGIRGQQERFFPVTGKRNSHAPIIGRALAEMFGVSLVGRWFLTVIVDN